MNIEPSKKIQVLIKDTRHRELIERQNEEILLLIRGEAENRPEFPSGVPLAKGILKDCEVGINLAALLNVEAKKNGFFGN